MVRCSDCVSIGYITTNTEGIIVAFQLESAKLSGHFSKHCPKHSPGAEFALNPGRPKARLFWQLNRD